MRQVGNRRLELIAVVSLLVGAFLGLTLLPWDVTGPAGEVVGLLLWTYLGCGAALLPALGLGAALAGFGRLSGVTIERVLALFTGLLVIVPSAIALATGIREAGDFPANYEAWTVTQRLVGIIPAMLTVAVTSVIGTAGAIILGVAALSALTMYTVDWHPFRRLAAESRTPIAKERWTLPSARTDEEPGGADWATRAIGGAPARPPRFGVRSLRRSGRRSRAAAQDDASQILPPLDLLAAPARKQWDAGEAELDRLGEVLIDTLQTFRVEGSIVGRTTGPVVTQYEVAPAPGVKVGRIAALADDLALAMRAQSIRIVAPIPGKAAVGVEVPNPTPNIVTLRELLEAPEWERARGALPVALGRNLEGRPVIADLTKMPHLLIAGATGSGKSVCINTITTSLIYRYAPRDLRLLMIDPKMVELSMYNALPHLRHPVVTDNREAAQALRWAIIEMERRYELFHANGARNMHDFNRKVAEGKPLSAVRDARHTAERVGAVPADAQGELPLPYEEGPLPFIVIIVDELADLMMTVQTEVEKPLAILAQKARATGIHLVLATQRPSVNVITGLIKANFPCRIAFRVASKVDSRTILDQNGAETLLGNGDMLFLPPGKSEPVRVQGAFMSTDETDAVTRWYGEKGARRVVQEATEEDIIEMVEALEAEEQGGGAEPGGMSERDALFREAAEVCISNQLGSTSLLQRRLRIGYGRAARVIDQLHEAGILGPPDGSKPREVLIDMAQLDEYCR